MSNYHAEMVAYSCMVTDKTLQADEMGNIYRKNKHGKLVKTSHHGAKYDRIRFSVDGQHFECMAHRLVYTYFFGLIPYGHDVFHKNGNTKDNSIQNLMLKNTTHIEECTELKKLPISESDKINIKSLSLQNSVTPMQICVMYDLTALEYIKIINPRKHCQPSTNSKH